MAKSDFIHARTFDTRWGLGLAFIDLGDDDDVERLVLQLWAPLGADGSDARVSLKIGLSANAPEAAHDAMSKGNREALLVMDAARFEAVFETADIAKTLDEACA